MAHSHDTQTIQYSEGWLEIAGGRYTEVANTSSDTILQVLVAGSKPDAAISRAGVLLYARGVYARANLVDDALKVFVRPLDADSCEVHWEVTT